MEWIEAILRVFIHVYVYGAWRMADLKDPLIIHSSEKIANASNKWQKTLSELRRKFVGLSWIDTGWIEVNLLYYYFGKRYSLHRNLFCFFVARKLRLSILDERPILFINAYESVHCTRIQRHGSTLETSRTSQCRWSSIAIEFSHLDWFELNESMAREIITSFYHAMEWISLVRISLVDFSTFFFLQLCSTLRFPFSVSRV